VTAGLASQSYWQWYYPGNYWVTATGAPATSPEDYQNDKITLKNPSARMFWADQYIPSPPADASITDVFKNFHKDGMNVLFLDGHANFVRGADMVDYGTANNLLTVPGNYSTCIVKTANNNF
jgi:prepilin-type processing-associated H-X9-DG protein